MSTGLECQVIQVEPDKWYYLLEDWNSPSGAWDWREYATAYGPFSDEAAALDHLHENHPNPGGHWSMPLEPGVERRDLSGDQTLAQRIAEAQAPATGRSWQVRF